MTDVGKQHLAQEKERMKKQADLKRAERSFQPGDWVFLKAQPYVQSSLPPRANQKLSFKFFRPYQVLSRFGEVAYKLKWLESCNTLKFLDFRTLLLGDSESSL
jgi:hypothetical protein